MNGSFLTVATVERLMEGNPKCRHLKKLTCKWTLRQAFICLRLRIPPPLHMYACVEYAYSQREGGGGRVEPERRLEGQQLINWDLINKCHKVPLQVKFLDDDILLLCL